MEKRAKQEAKMSFDLIVCSIKVLPTIHTMNEVGSFIKDVSIWHKQKRKSIYFFQIGTCLASSKHIFTI